MENFETNSPAVLGLGCLGLHEMQTGTALLSGSVLMGACFPGIQEPACKQDSTPNTLCCNNSAAFSHKDDDGARQSSEKRTIQMFLQLAIP
eukprot:6355197-Amphidinium_carterae.1